MATTTGPKPLQAAMAGCERLFLLSPPHPAQPTREKAANRCRPASGRESRRCRVGDADPASPVACGRWHADIDEHLISSGLGTRSCGRRASCRSTCCRSRRPPWYPR